MYNIPWNAQRILHHLATHPTKQYASEIAEATHLTPQQVAGVTIRQLASYVNVEKIYKDSGTPINLYKYNGKPLPRYVYENMEEQ